MEHSDRDMSSIPCEGSELAGASRCRSSSKEFLQVRLRRDAQMLCTPARTEVDRSQLCTSRVDRERKGDRSKQVGSLQHSQALIISALLNLS